MAFVVVENGVVIDRVGGNPQHLFRPEYAARFVEVPDEVQVGFIEADGEFSAPPVPISAVVSPRQIRQALTRIGLRQAVENAVAAGDQDVQDWWEFATEYQRTHPMVIAMGKALGKSDADLDALWQLAGSL